MKCEPKAVLPKGWCTNKTAQMLVLRPAGWRACVSTRSLSGAAAAATLPGHTSRSSSREFSLFLGFSKSPYLVVMFFTHLSLFQSLDYDRCINDPYLEVLETMDNKVSPLLISWDRLSLKAAFIFLCSKYSSTYPCNPWPFNPFHEISTFIPSTFPLPARVPSVRARGLAP